MSVEEVRPGVWAVRWREPATRSGKHRKLVVGSEREARKLDRAKKKQRLLAELGVAEPSEETVEQLAKDWWELHARPNLAPATLEGYAAMLDAHIVPRLGQLRLRELSTRTVQQWRLDLERAGVGPASVRKAMIVLQAILERGVAWKRVGDNPAKLAPKPKQQRQRRVVPLTPALVEQLRALLVGDGRPGDAALVSMLAYEGPRPQDALALTVGHLGEQTIAVDRLKTDRPAPIDYFQPVRADVAAWLLARGRPGPREPVFPNRRGEHWTPSDYRNWRRRVFVPAMLTVQIEAASGARPKLAKRRAGWVAEAGGESAEAKTAEAALRTLLGKLRNTAPVPAPRPYDLRHTCASLLFHAGWSLPEVAEHLGHSVQVCSSTYAHVVRELKGQPTIPVEEQIRRARDQLARRAV